MTGPDDLAQLRRLYLALCRLRRRDAARTARYIRSYLKEVTQS